MRRRGALKAAAPSSGSRPSKASRGGATQPEEPARLKHQLSDDCVLASLPSLASTISDGDCCELVSVSREELHSQDDLLGVGNWQPDLAQLHKCLSVQSLATVARGSSSDSELANKDLHVCLVGGDSDLQVFTLHAEAAKHRATARRGRQHGGQRLFRCALHGITCKLDEPVPADQGPPPAPSIAAEEPASKSISGVQGDHAAAELEPSSEPQQQASTAPSSTHVETDRACMRPESSQGGALAHPPALLQVQPIMIFGTAATLALRVQEWTAELLSFNCIQAQLRLISGTDFVPLRMCSVVQMLLARAGLFPQTIVSGAARFQELLEGLPQLAAQAADCGLWQFGQFGTVLPDGQLQVVGYKPEAMSLSQATPQLLSCFVACTFHEANRMESGPGFAVFTLTPAGGIMSVPPTPKFCLADLVEWMAMVLGPAEGEQGWHRAQKAALIAAPACSRVEGAVLMVA